MARPRILIVGGGVAGLSTAWHLARRGGVQVTLVEREADFGRQSSGKNAAILRTAAGDPVELELALRGARFLQSPPPGFAPSALVQRCGLILAARSDAGAGEELAAWVDGTPADVPVEALTPALALRLAPHYEGPLARAWRFPEQGRLDTVALVQAYARGAREAGATLETHVEVARPVLRDGRLSGVHTEDGRRIEADTVVLAAGGWAARLGAAAGSRLALRATQRHLLVSTEDARVDANWPVLWTLDEAFYLRPEGRALLMCGCDEADVDPDAPDDPLVEELIRSKALRLTPRFAGLATARFWSGLRTFTADGRFAVGWDVDVRGLFWVAGLGGAGMVTSPEIGRIAASAILGEGAGDRLAQALSPERFARRSSAGSVA